MLSMVEYGKVWVINTREEYEHALEVLEGNTFCADMSDDIMRSIMEKAEIRRQLEAVMKQAEKFNT